MSWYSQTHFYLFRQAGRPGILIGGAGDLQLNPKNEKPLELWNLSTLLAIQVSIKQKSALKSRYFSTYFELFRQAGRPGIFIGGAGDLQLDLKNEKPPELWDLGSLLA